LRGYQPVARDRVADVFFAARLERDHDEGAAGDVAAHLVVEL
jgi:hypothetical protein